MKPLNPYAPPETSVRGATPLVARSRWAALWWFPFGISCGVAVMCFLFAMWGIDSAFDQFRQTGFDLNAGRPPLGRTLVFIAIMTLVTGALSWIAQSWYRRRWRRALLLMALFYASGVALMCLLGGR